MPRTLITKFDLNHNYGGYHKPPPPEHDAVRDKLEADVAKFLAGGGKITEHGSEANAGLVTKRLGIPGHYTKGTKNGNKS